MSRPAVSAERDLDALDLERMLHPNTNLKALHGGGPLVLVRGRGVRDSQRPKNCKHASAAASNSNTARTSADSATH